MFKKIFTPIHTMFNNEMPINKRVFSQYFFTTFEFSIMNTTFFEDKISFIKKLHKITIENFYYEENTNTKEYVGLTGVVSFKKPPQFILFAIKEDWLYDNLLRSSLI